MLDHGWKRLLSGLLALVLVVGMLPPVTVAAEDLDTISTTETTEAWENVETSEPAGTEVTETDPVETESEEAAPTEPEETIPEETTPEETEPEETTEQTLPEEVAAVQALIDALPAVDTVTEADYAAAQETYDAYEALTEDQKALIQGAEKFQALFDWFNTQATTLGTIANGTCGESLTWTLDDTGTLTISGTGDMADYTYSSPAPWHASRDSITAAVIEDGVTSIGEYAFSNCTKLESITIADSVTSIGSDAFYGCAELASVTLSEGVTSIGDFAFKWCSKLTSIAIPEGVTRIGDSAFSGCRSLTSVTIPESVTSIGSDAFSGCRSLTSVTIPESVTSIGGSVFSSCNSLISMTVADGNTVYHSDGNCIIQTASKTLVAGCSASVIPADGSVTRIGDSAFSGCSGLTSITIPESVTSIGSYAFSGCSGLTSMTVADGNTVYHSDRNCIIETASKTLVAGCSASVIPADGSVTSIGKSAFYSCGDLNRITIPQSVTNIGSYAFAWCSKLTSIAIPESVTSIGDSAFSSCTSLTDVYYPGTQEQWNAISIGSYNTKLTGATIHIGSNCVGPADHSYEAVVTDPTCTDQGYTTHTCTACGDSYVDAYVDALEHDFQNYVSDGNATCTEDGTETAKCERCDETDSRTEADSALGHAPVYVAALEPTYFAYGSNEHYSCERCEMLFLDEECIQETTLEELQIPMLDSVITGTCGDNLTWVLDDEGTLTISGTGDMEDFTWDSVPWGSYTDSITAAVISEGVTSIGDRAFYNCDSLTNVVIPEGVTSIDYNAFYDCDSLTSVTIPASVETIADHAFAWCRNLVSISFAHRTTDALTIEDNAFFLSSYDHNNTEYCPTAIQVPSAKHVHPAVAQYNWVTSQRTVSYVSTMDLPVTALSLQADTEQTEVGVENPIRLTMEPMDTTSDILWSIIPGTGTAAVTQSGVVTGITAGIVTVRVASAEDDSVFAELPLTILSPTGGAPTAITVTTGGLYENEVAVGQTIPMIAVFTPVNATERDLTWEVENNTGTAQIDQQGNLTGLTPGSVTVWVEGPNGCIGSYKVDVVRYAEGLEIFLDGEANARGLGIGEKRYLSTVLSPEDTTTEKVEWAVFNGTGAAELEKAQWEELYWITGTRAGTVTLVAVAKDSRAVQASIELEVTDTIRPYAVTGGNIYYNTETGYITGSDASVTAVNIPAQIGDTTIVGILPDAFANVDSWHNYQNNTTLTTVFIPATVREIGARAFCNCTALTALRFAKGSQLTTVGEQAFYYCGALTNLTIPESVTTVGSKAFSGLSGLKYLTISGEVDSESWGFGYYGYDGDGLQTITYTGSFIRGGCVTESEEGWTHYQYGVVSGAKKLILSETVTQIGDYAFGYGHTTTEVEIRGAVTRIGDYAFSDFYNLKTINLPDTLTYLGKGCFKNCNQLEIIDLSLIPDNIDEARYPLLNKASLPEYMIRATNGQASFAWGTDYSTDEIAYVAYYGETPYLHSVKSGQVKLICLDKYTGLRGSKTVEVKAGLLIEPMVPWLISGESINLYAYTPSDYDTVKVTWRLRDEDKNYATLSSSGKLKAKTVSRSVQVTVYAQGDGDLSGSMTVWILPKATGISITQGAKLTADMAQTQMLDLTAQVQPAGALDMVQWTSSNQNVARVDRDTGNVELLKPGTVTITASTTDGSEKSDKVTLTVYYVDTASKLTATSDAPAMGLQPGQTANLTVKGRDVLPVDALSYSIPENQQHIATVKDGVVTAGNTPGTVTVTVSLNGDPLKRTATCKIKVIPYEVEALSLTAAAGEPARLDTHNGEVLLILDAEAVKEEAYTFTISAQGMNYLKQWADTTADWATGNTAIATVKANADGSATVTVKKGSSGECVITGTAKGLTKATARLWLSVRDYAPRLETTSPAMNLYQSSSVDVALQMSYENGIESVCLYEKKEISQHFTAAWENGTLTITSLEGVKKGTYTQTLKVTCDNGEPYDYTLKIKVTETAPSVTVKQTLKPNLFYTHTTAALTLAAKNAQVTDATVIGGNFTGEFENGVLTLTSDVLNPGKKVTLAITVAGYEKPVEKTISLSTVTTAPKLKLSATSSVINLKLKPAAADRFTTFRVLNGTEVLELTMDDIAYSGSFATCGVANDTITLTLTGEKGGTATLFIQKSDWTKPVKLTHKVTVQTALPTLKLGATTLKLNSVFPDVAAETTVSLSQANLALTDVVITPKTSGLEDVLSVTCDGGKITAKITGAVKAGTYSYTCTGYVGETPLKAVTLKVTVSATNPKVKLASTTFKLNKTLAGKETVTTKVTVPAGYTLVGFDTTSNNFTYESGYLTATLGKDDAGGSYTLYPILKPNGSDVGVTLSTGIKVKVTAYSASVTATVSTKGKLDTLNPDSALTYTVKLKNCAGMVSGVTLSGQDAALFNAHVDETGKVIVTTKETVRYATDQTYKVTLDMTVCGQTVSKGISFKVTQSALKVSPGPSSLTCYQALGTVSTTLSVSSPATAEIAQVTLGAKTAAAFRNAFGEEGTVKFDNATGRVNITLKNPGLLTPGKSYTVYLAVTPKNAAANTTPIQVKLTVKIKG